MKYLLCLLTLLGLMAPIGNLLAETETDLAAMIKAALEMREEKPELFKGAKGVLVKMVVEGSQGEKAGLKPGDIIILYDGKPVNALEELIRFTSEKPESETVSMELIRNGISRSVDLHGGKIGVAIVSVNMAPYMDRLQEEGEQAYYRSAYATAIEKWQQGLDLAQKSGNKKYISQFIGNMGVVYDNLGQYDKALSYYQQALAIDREIGDRRGEGNNLTNMGVVYWNLGQYGKALSHYRQALAIKREIGDRQGEGGDLTNMGVVYHNLGQYGKSLLYYKKALLIYIETGNRIGEGGTMANMGVVYWNLGQYNNALSHFKRALEIRRKIGNQQGVSDNLIHMGLVYMNLNQYDKAMFYYKQALGIYEKIGDRRGKGDTHTNMAGVYWNLSQYEKALSHYQKALAIRREIKDRRGEGSDLANIGLVYDSMNQHDEALSHYQQGLTIHREIGDQPGETSDLLNIGYLHMEMKKPSKASAFFQQALPIAEKVNAPDSLWRIHSGLSETFATQNHPLPAIFFGKKAVNTIQDMRSHIAAMEKTLQKSFLKGKSHVYRDLADLLIDQGRLPEAQQVLAMLKEEEYFDFIRRDSESDVRTTQATYTAVEAPWEKRYQEINQRLAALGKEKEALEKKRKLGLTDAEKDRFRALTRDLGAARQAFEQFLAELVTELGKVSQARAAEIGEKNLEALQAFQGILRQLGPDVVAVHYLIMQDQLRLILTTPQVQLVRSHPVAEAELNRKILAFRQTLQNPNRNPFPQARELYDIVFAPIAEDLKQAGAKTLMLSLDGVLRYLPVAALHDGTGYVTESFRAVVFTEAAKTKLTQTAAPDWKLAGMGLSREIEGFSGLPSVAGELEGIVKKDDADADGVLPGQVYLNGEFTETALEDLMLFDPHPVLHIASHFVFRPGTEKDSFLLLGDGARLSLAQVRNAGYDFNGVDLLTLSACETAMGGGRDADGREIEGFGAIAQNKGARAVLATLWPVADESTGVFMQNLYRLRQEQGLTKAEALRRAQRIFIRGTQSPEASETGGPGRGKVVWNSSETGAEDAAFVPDPERPYGHPFYWAPFILMGNWL